MAYDIDTCDQYMDELLDKMGGDYFPLAVKFGRFATATLEFIRDNAKRLEIDQEASDNIKPLIIRTEYVLTAVVGETGLYQMAEPVNYLRTISIYPFATVNNIKTKLARKVHIVKEGQRLAYERDPNRKPTPFEPAIYRLDNFFQIATNDAINIYPSAEFAYIKKPTFGNITTPTNRIVNLPDTSIEIIMQRTCEALRFSSADETASNIYNFDQTFGKTAR